jgi:hypothetical protein
MELSRLLALAGALPFVFLGAVHAIHTPTSVEQRKGLSPRDISLPAAMARSGLGLTRRTDVWRAWVGFNFSHSLGAMLLGALVLLAVRSPAAFALDGPVVLPLATLVAGIYLLLAIKYWFRTPAMGVALGLVCLAGAWILQLLGG